MTVITTTTNDAAATFAPRPAGELFALDRLDDAYRLAGVEPPTRGNPALELVHGLPSLDEQRVRVAREALTAADPHAWLEDALATLARAAAVDGLREALARELAAVTAETLPELRERAATDLAPAFTRTVKALAKAAKALPAGHAPLDLAAVVEADATRQMKAARAALSDLAVYASLVEPPTGAGDAATVAPRILPLFTVVDVEDVPVMEVGPGATTERAPSRGGVRKFCGDAMRHGLDRALIGVARDEYAGVRFALASSNEEAWARVERAKVAHEQVFVRNRPHVVVR